MFKKFVIVLFLLVIFFPTTARGKKAILKITEPKDSATITERKITVKGISKGLESDTSIFIYVKTNREYFQGDTTIKKDGSWCYYPVVIGGVDDRNFYAEIYAKTGSGVISNTVKVFRAK